MHLLLSEIVTACLVREHAMPHEFTKKLYDTCSLLLSQNRYERATLGGPDPKSISKGCPSLLLIKRTGSNKRWKSGRSWEATFMDSLN